MQKSLNVKNVRELKIKSIKKIGNEDVYNITMCKNHNYFANGILVSNCDAARYIVNTRIKDDKTWLRSSNEEVDFDVLLQEKDIQEEQQQEESLYCERPGRKFGLF